MQDVDRNGQPDINQVEYVQNIIGPVYFRSWDTLNMPLIPNQFIKKEWDQKDGSLKSIKIDVEKVQQYLKGYNHPSLLPFPYPYPGTPLTVGGENEGVIVEVQE